MAASCTSHTGNEVWNPGMCPVQESNQRPLGSWVAVQLLSTPAGPFLLSFILHLILLQSHPLSELKPKSLEPQFTRKMNHGSYHTTQTVLYNFTINTTYKYLKFCNTHLMQYTFTVPFPCSSTPPQAGNHYFVIQIYSTISDECLTFQHKHTKIYS